MAGGVQATGRYELAIIEWARCPLPSIYPLLLKLSTNLPHHALPQTSASTSKQPCLERITERRAYVLRLTLAQHIQASNP